MLSSDYITIETDFGDLGMIDHCGRGRIRYDPIENRTEFPGTISLSKASIVDANAPQLTSESLSIWRIYQDRDETDAITELETEIQCSIENGRRRQDYSVRSLGKRGRESDYGRRFA